MVSVPSLEVSVKTMIFRHKPNSSKILLFVLIAILFLNLSRDLKGQPAGGAEFGVYAMAAAATALKVEFNLELIRAGHFVKENGSSAAQLRQLATETGLWTIALQGVSTDYVRNSSSPLILNLRRSFSDENAGHWVTYLGDEGGYAVVFDNLATEKIRTVEWGELRMMMNGEAILVDLAPPSQLATMAHTALAASQTWMWLIPGLGMLLFLPSMGLAREFLIVLCTSVVTGTISAHYSAAGFGRNPSAVAYIASTHCDETFPDVSYQQFMTMLSNPGVAIIDARPKWLYEMDTIEGSINFPVDSRPDGLRVILEQIAAKRAVFVFCGGPKCEWDRVIACRLRAAGVTDIRIYEEGLSTYNFRKLREN